MRITDAEAQSTDEGMEHRFRDLLITGALLSESDFCARRGCNARALDGALSAGRLFAFEHEGARFVPAFYLDQTFRRQQLQAITKVIKALPGGSKWQFFNEPKASLGGETPLQALARGEFASTKRAAEGFVTR
jgi:hypothetical protein